MSEPPTKEHSWVDERGWRHVLLRWNDGAVCVNSIDKRGGSMDDANSAGHRCHAIIAELSATISLVKALREERVYVRRELEIAVTSGIPAQQRIVGELIDRLASETSPAGGEEPVELPRTGHDYNPYDPS